MNKIRKKKSNKRKTQKNLWEHILRKKKLLKKQKKNFFKKQKNLQKKKIEETKDVKKQKQNQTKDFIYTKVIYKYKRIN